MLLHRKIMHAKREGQGKEKSPCSIKERGIWDHAMYGGWLLQRCNKSDWRLFYLGAGEGVGAITAEDEDLTVAHYFL